MHRNISHLLFIVAEINERKCETVLMDVQEKAEDYVE